MMYAPIEFEHIISFITGSIYRVPDPEISFIGGMIFLMIFFHIFFLSLDRHTDLLNLLHNLRELQIIYLYN
jgi:hypothetical protein